MKNISVIILVSVVLALSACMATETPAPVSTTTTELPTLSPEERKATILMLTNEQKYNIGSYTSYSDVCAQFQGNSVDLNILVAIKQQFENDTDFQRGFDRFVNFEGADKVIGLTDCEDVKKSLIKIHLLLLS